MPASAWQVAAKLLLCGQQRWGTQNARWQRGEYLMDRIYLRIFDKGQTGLVRPETSHSKLWKTRCSFVGHQQKTGSERGHLASGPLTKAELFLSLGRCCCWKFYFPAQMWYVPSLPWPILWLQRITSVIGWQLPASHWGTCGQRASFRSHGKDLRFWEFTNVGVHDHSILSCRNPHGW